MAEAKVTMSKAVIDDKIERIMKVKADIKELQKIEKSLLGELQTLYTEEASVKEEVYGKKYMMTKVPVNNGAHKYDADKVKTMIAAIDKKASRGVIKTVKVVDADAFEQLVKDDYIPVSMADDARLNKWTFKSLFNVIGEQ